MGIGRFIMGQAPESIVVCSKRILLNLEHILLLTLGGRWGNYASCVYTACRNVAAVIGVCWLALTVWRQIKILAGWFCAFFLAPWGISRINLKKYGPWAGILDNSPPPPPPPSLASHTLQSAGKEGLVTSRTTSCSGGMQ